MPTYLPEVWDVMIAHQKSSAKQSFECLRTGHAETRTVEE
jgi:hypothetical protein